MSLYVSNIVTDLVRLAVPGTRRNLGASLSLKVHFRPGMVLTNQELLDLHKDISAIAENLDHPICNQSNNLEELRKQYSDGVVSLIQNGSKPEAFLWSPLLEFEKGNILHAGLIVSSGNTKTSTTQLLGLGTADIMLRNGIFSYFVTNISCHPRIVEIFSETVYRPWPVPDANLLRPPEDYRSVFRVLFENYMRKNIKHAVPNFQRFTITSAIEDMGFKHGFHQLKRPKRLRYLTFCKTWLNYEKVEEDLVQVGKMTPFHGLAASLKLEALCMISRMKNWGNPSQGWEVAPKKVAAVDDAASVLSRSTGPSSGSSLNHDTGEGNSSVTRELDYSRNWFFIDEETQLELAKMRILVVGLGIGSKFAEASLRLGIQHLTICDGDTVELSNLNRQNFEYGDIGISKAKATYARLKRISPNANLAVVDKFVIKEDLDRLVPEHDIVINAIDFDREEDFKHCTAIVQRHGKTELFPINLGFGSALTINDASTPTWDEEFTDATTPFKHQIIARLASSENIPNYLLEAWNRYSLDEGENRSYDPQLGVATDVASSLLTTTLVRKAKGEKLTLFPQFLYLDANEPRIL